MSAKDQLEEKGAELLIKMIDFTVKSMDDVVEFSKQQIPDILHQLLTWKATYASVWMMVGLVLVIVSFVWGKKVNRWMQKDGDAGVFHILTVILFCSGCWQIIENLLVILQILVSPKIYLIEYGSELINK